MKYAFYLLAAVSALVFIYNAIKLGDRLSRPLLHLITEEKIRAIDSLSTTATVPKQRVQEFLREPSAVTTETNSNQNLYFWLSFLATALTAGATLVASIQAATNNPGTSKRSAILVAIFTFCATLANTAASHFNDQSTTKKTAAADIRAYRQRQENAMG